MLTSENKWVKNSFKTFHLLEVIKKPKNGCNSLVSTPKRGALKQGMETTEKI